VSGFEVFEVYNPGAVNRLSTTSFYTDDNAIACCGADAAASSAACNGLPICSQTTAWEPIWTGTAGRSGNSATIFNPPICPCTAAHGVSNVDKARTTLSTPG
jgi:hypothetical protein